MTHQDYQKKANSVVGNTLRLLESYSLPLPAINTIRRSLFDLLDRHFLGVIDDEKL